MTGPGIETADLLVFLAVARAGSFGGAAVELQLAQPSVSARMAALERRLGVRLFERTHRGTTLTPAGERFGDYARRCVDLLSETEAAVRAETVDRLVVAAPASLGAAVFPTVLTAMAGQPVDVVCRIAHSDEAVAALLDGSAHAAFVFQRVLPPGLDSTLVASSPVVAVLAPAHACAALAMVRPHDLLGTPVAVHNWSDEARQVADVFASIRRTLDHPVRLVGAPDVAIDLAVSSGYLAVVPHYAAAGALAEGRLRPVDVPGIGLEIQVRLVHRAEAAQRLGLHLLHETVPALAKRIAPIRTSDLPQEATGTARLAAGWHVGEATSPAKTDRHE